jgi:hypothetical protein
MRVVDILKSIQIKEKQRYGLVLPSCPCHRLVETVRKQTAIRKAGQLVVICKLAHLHHGLVKQSNSFPKTVFLSSEVIDQSKRSSQLLLAGRQGATERCGARKRQSFSVPRRI